MSTTFTDSPWKSALAAIDYLTQGERTEKGLRRLSPRLLAREVSGGRLRAAKVGGRGQLLYHRDWLDQWLENQAAPIPVTARRRA